MKYLAAYALLKLGGNAEPTAVDVEAFLKENGVKADKERISELIEKFGGKDLNKLVETGVEQMSAMGAQSVMPAPVAVEENDGAAGPEKVEVHEPMSMGGLFDSEDEY